MTEDSSQDRFQFDEFCLIPGERVLVRNGTRVALGSRALDILIALTSKAGELVAKQDLIAEVWCDVPVEEVGLRVHIAALRKALGGDRGTASYIANVSGRGYCFVAPVARRTGAPPATGLVVPEVRYNCGARASTSIVGQESSIAAIETKLMANRFVTITGAGGIGKTTIASALADRIGPLFNDGSYWISLDGLNDGVPIEDVLSSQLGLSPGANPLSRILAFLRARHTLLIFDNCEHLLQQLARLSRLIALAAPKVHILATSREPIRSDLEHIYHLPPLAVPPSGKTLSARDALAYPAVQLLVERIRASGCPFSIGDAEAPVIASICRRLDGSPLAIELAATLVPSYGLHAFAAFVDNGRAVSRPGVAAVDLRPVSRRLYRATGPRRLEADRRTARA